MLSCSDGNYSDDFLWDLLSLISAFSLEDYFSSSDSVGWTIAGSSVRIGSSISTSSGSSAGFLTSSTPS